MYEKKRSWQITNELSPEFLEFLIALQESQKDIDRIFDEGWFAISKSNKGKQQVQIKLSSEEKPKIIEPNNILTAVNLKDHNNITDFSSFCEEQNIPCLDLNNINQTQVFFEFLCNRYKFYQIKTEVAKESKKQKEMEARQKKIQEEQRNLQIEKEKEAKKIETAQAWVEENVPEKTFGNLTLAGAEILGMMKLIQK